ncbi:MAG TPA: pirin family protein [Patescibacteria group bacterium]|nr:pirin family protein [Patescibacteria group bacterium]
MMNIRKKDERGETGSYWLQSWHSFSFGEYYDPHNMGFGPLRVINEDIVRAGMGFDTHGHANMEIITCILEGAIEHKDSLGNGGIIRPGDVQLMSAGKGILHSEKNPSETDDVHLLQIWIMPNVAGTRPGYQQTSFNPAEFSNALRLVVSPDGEKGSLVIKQDARLWVAKLEEGKSVSLEMQPERKYWVQMARGSADVFGRPLTAGDALGLDNESGKADIKATADAEFLVFELPR